MALQLTKKNQNQITSSYLVLLRLLLQLLLRLTKTSWAFSIVRPGCQKSCGDVEIPYPFGIGPGCYFHDSYSVECKNSSSRYTPYLTSIDLEVRSISLDANSVVVNHPVIKSSPNCPLINNGSGSSSSVNLRNTPFLFSSKVNTFVAAGCNNHAVMTDLYTTITECTLPSTCTISGLPKNSRCEAEIPQKFQYLQAFNATFSGGTGGEQPCTYAFLAQHKENTNYLAQYSFDVQYKNTTHVPVILEWIFQDNGSDPNTGGGDKYRTCVPLSAAYSLPDRTCTVVEGIRCYCKILYDYYPSGKGNPYLLDGCKADCLDDPSLPGCNKSKTIIIGVCAGTTGLLFLLTAGWWSTKVIKKRNDKKCKEKFFKRNGGFLLQQQVFSNDGCVEKTKLFNSNELEKATDYYNEDRILGQGGQGTVYKGTLSDGRIVAVKKSKLLDEGKVEQFINEVVILSQIIHRNVVKLLGCCLETDVPLLVYEFVPNGTLFQHIHDPNDEFPLTWEMRFRIVTEVAGALSYLHYAASVPIYHRDIKSTNILLDEKYKAKVADFGTSRSIAIDQTHLTTQVQGTFGYLDPEFFQTSQFTDKSDVYSFGVVIVELLTGQKPISFIGSQESKSLVTYFMQSMEENRLLEILDPRILKEGRKEEMTAIAHLARRCLHWNGKKRPTMKDVAAELEGIRMSQGGSTTHQHFEEVEYNNTDPILAWDIASTSTRTFIDSGTSTGTTSSFDVQPLFHTK